MKQNFNLKLIALGLSLVFAACNGDESKTSNSSSDSTTNKMSSDSSAPKSANDAVSVAPDHYSVLKDSAGIRILDVSYKPGDSSAMHSHPDVALYVVGGSKTEFTMQDGSKVVRDMKSGDAGVMPAQTHSVKNIGTTPTKVILVEVNRPNTPATSIGADMDPLKVAASMHKLVQDTMGIRVMIFTAKPGESTPKHSHPDHAIYVISGGKGEFTTADGQKIERDLASGTALINPATTHSFKNVDTKPIKVLVVEVNRAAK